MSNIKEKENQKPFDLPTELLLWENKRAEIKTQQDFVSKELTHLENLQKQETDILKPIQNEIRSGRVSIGDKIKDFCFVCFEGDAEKETQQTQLYNLEAQLNQHKSEFVLLKTIKSEKHGYIDFNLDPKPHPELYHWEEELQIGIISKEIPLDVDLKNYSVIIAPEKHCSLTGNWQFSKTGESKSALINKPLSISWNELTKLGKSLESVYSGQPRIFKSIYPTEEQIKSQGIKDLAVEIIIGDKRVLDYLKYNQDIYPEVAKQLGRRVLKQGYRGYKGYR